MARVGWCLSCERSVFVPQDDEAVCPVCAAPLLEVEDEPAEAS
jgi:Zn finger protein HypA/HybF involved in hydrogenase expression